MNAKKIMGAVLVALLAAALFVGAGAAADNGTVFVYQKTPTYNQYGTWNLDGATVTIDANGVIPSSNFVPGVYKKGEDTLTVKYPTATITAVADDGVKYIVVNGGMFYTGNPSATLTLNVSSAVVAPVSALVTYPNGTAINSTLTSGNLVLNTQIPSGTYKVQGVFAATNFIEGTPANYLVGADVFTFVVGSAADATVTASADTVIIGENVQVTVKGKPGAEYSLNFTEYAFNVPADQLYVLQDTKSAYFQMPNNGELTLSMQANETGTQKVTLYLKDGTVYNTTNTYVSVKVVKGTIEVTSTNNAAYIGDDFELEGTTTVNGDLCVYLKGTNFPLTQLNESSNSLDRLKATLKDKTWSVEIPGELIRSMNPDVGTYTVYITTLDGASAVADIEKASYATTVVDLKQPFISVITAPEIVIQNTEAKFIGTAEAADAIAYYIFGTNKFVFANDTANYGGANAADVENNEFTITLKKELTNSLDAGQYFMVIQHPMYNGKFNIWAEADGDIVQKPLNGAETVLFNVKDRQKANAAQALCDALDTQNIDDMYVKLSFIVAKGTSTINPIPSEITQGTQLTVSGSSTGMVGETVVVEMMSTAFAAVPKETVGSASFIALITTVQEDGTWEVTFDTSGLNVDEYTVSAAVGQLDATTAKVNVIEGAPEQPDQPDVPGDEPEQPGDEPEAPATPGFGALAALAGLGAVAVLLLRRE